MRIYQKKKVGTAGELLVAEYYQNKGYTLLHHNYTIQGGELDLILEHHDHVAFIEVKVIDHCDDIFDYISHKKLGTIKKTIEQYLMAHPTSKPYILNVVFVKHNSIVEIYENVTNT